MAGRLATASHGRATVRHTGRSRSHADGSAPFDHCRSRGEVGRGAGRDGRELEIPSFSRLPKQEQMVRLLRAQTEKDGQIFGDGILEIIEDGFGFLRGPRFLPGPDDIYVSQSQIRRFGLRTGDRSAARCGRRRTTRSSSACCASRPSTASTRRRRAAGPSFDTLTPIFPLELINLETSRTSSRPGCSTWWRRSAAGSAV